MLILLAAAWPLFLRAEAAGDPKPLPTGAGDRTPVSMPVPSDSKAAGNDALLARYLKLLNYGDMNPFYRPSKVDAAVALGLLGDERAVGPLVEHLENEDNNMLRMQIVRALAWIGSPSAVPALEHTLRDKYPFLRKHAAMALKDITGKDYEYDKTGLPDPNRLRKTIEASAAEAAGVSGKKD